MHKPILLILTLFLPMPGICDSPPGSFADILFNGGRIASVNQARQTLLILDNLYYLNGRTRIEAGDGGILSASALETGQRIGFNYVIDDQKRRVLTRVRLTQESSSSP